MNEALMGFLICKFDVWLGSLLGIAVSKTYYGNLLNISFRKALNEFKRSGFAFTENIYLHWSYE